VQERLEIKELRAADLYYKVGQYRAAAIAYGTLLNNYPESKALTSISSTP
jgi:outer membrane protein assembly factor BamD